MSVKNTDKAPLDGPIIYKIVLIDQITREQTGDFEASSLPGHLIHIVYEGQVRQISSGHEQNISAHKAVWYCEDEQVRGQIVTAPWKFYTINFIAPTLPAPLIDNRVFDVTDQTVQKARELYEIWTGSNTPPTVRHLQLHHLLLDLILDIIPRSSQSHCVESSTHIWWSVEEQLKKDLSRPIDLETIAKLSHRSRRTVVRACRLATGLSPIKRIKQVRLSYARAHVLYSQLSMTEIAFRVGFPRVQEFSRDYHLYYGVAPSQDRKDGVRYRQLEKSQEKKHDPP